MTREEFSQPWLAYLISMRQHFDKPQHDAYYRVLKDIPANLFAMTIDRLMSEPRQFVPKAGELKAMVEQQRQLLIAAHPYDGCCDCQESKGWRQVKINEAYFVERCHCHGRYQQKLAELGVPNRPVVMLTEGERHEEQD